MQYASMRSGSDDAVIANVIAFMASSSKESAFN